MNKYYRLKSLILISLLFFYLSPHIINASFERYQSNPIIKIDNNISWLQSKLYGPSVIYTNNHYVMLFSTFDGIKREIAKSTAISINSWSNPELIPDLNWNIINQTDIGIEHPMLYQKNDNTSLYHLWFNNVYANLSNFNLYYSSSKDRASWKIPQKIIFSNPDLSWIISGMTAPAVIFNNSKNLYEMWFTARGNSAWRVGYASSIDGIFWFINSTPVLIPDQAWEKVSGNYGIGNVTVLLINNIYHMWYHGDQDIGHAVSYNGIDWIKDPSNPVLSPNRNSLLFDNLRVFDPFVLHKDNKYYMFYTGMSTDGKWQIGLATSDSPGFVPDTPTPGQVTITISPTVTPSPTIQLTNTPTPTVTSSPTPTYTPTPTTDPKTAPVILIPGMGASWNSHALYSCSLTDNGPSKWKMTPFLSIYQRLINTLTGNAKLKLNKDLFIYNYDWRQPLDTQADNLKNYLDSLIKSNSSVKKFRLVGHSLGGLVIRSYLERYNNIDNKVIQALTIGTPHQGTLLAYPLWENGEIWSENLTSKIALSQILEICKLKKTDLRASFKSGSISYPSKKDLIRSLIPSLHSLLPTFDYLYQNGKVKKTDSLTHQNDWLGKNLFPENSYQIKFGTLSGTGQSTLSNFVVSNPPPSDLAKDIWADGKPIKNNFVKDGDGTVLSSSSKLDGAGNETVNENHLKIVSSREAIQKILLFLQYDGVKVASEVDLPEINSDNAMVISTDLSTHLILTDLSGKVLGEADNILVRYNPHIGVYKFSIIPKESGEAVLDAMFIGQIKEYSSRREKIKLNKNVRQTFLLTYLGKNTNSIRIMPFQ